MSKPRLFAVLALVLLLAVAGCSLFEEGDPTAERPTLAFATVTLTPEPTPTRTPTPTATPIAPRVEMDDQPLDDRGELTAAEVALPGPGWLVILADDDGEPGEPIGQTALAGGVHANVAITVDPQLATETLYARLHLDAGTEGVFEYPGEDEPYAGEPGTTFAVELQLPRPIVEAAEQTVGESNIVTVARVELLEPGWVAIHVDDDGQAGAVIGGVRLEAGLYENVPVTIDRRYATPTLHAVLHEDDGEIGLLEFPDGDQPLLFNGQPVVAAFAAHYPPDIFVYDQPFIDGSIVVERVISEGPGWLAVYSDQDGQPGLIIGFAALEDGVNEAVRIDLIESAVTLQLYARLHQDTTPGDEFDFPGNDPVVRYEDRMPQATAFRTDLGAAVVVRDQTLADDSVVVSMVVVPVNAWVAVHAAADDGQPAGMLGRTFVPAGINRNVVVSLDPAPENAPVVLVLYEDQGEAEVFDALGVDPLLTNADNRLIRVPFVIGETAE
ncbi:MAG: hypothetical protein KA170_11445 [Candidatus Promineofilum sp.]|nr:hypothetical protein [Promineifilum sp.]